MEKDQKNGSESMRFCPICGHEGHDIMCPVCNEPMESIDLEMDKILTEGDEDENGLFSDDISLEEAEVKETANQKGDENDVNL